MFASGDETTTKGTSNDFMYSSNFKDGVNTTFDQPTRWRTPLKWKKGDEM
jgi:hypothetical protein